MIFRSTNTDRNNFRSYVAEAPLSNFIKHTISKYAILVSEWIFSGIKNFIHHNKFNHHYQTATLGSHMNALTISTTSISITRRGVVGHLLHSKQSAVAAHPPPKKKRTRKGKVALNKRFRPRLKTKEIGTKVFWKIFNQILNKGKAFVPSIINDPRSSFYSRLPS